MKKIACAGLLLALAFLLPALVPAGLSQVSGAQGEAALVQEIVAQQAVVVSNQEKIDQAIVALAEEIRLARIYARRGGNVPK